MPKNLPLSTPNLMALANLFVPATGSIGSQLTRSNRQNIAYILGKKKSIEDKKKEIKMFLLSLGFHSTEVERIL